MAEIAVSVCIMVLKKTSTVVADLIAQKGSRFSRLQEEIALIEREMTHIQSYLEDVEHQRGKDIFIRDVRNLAFDVEDTMEKYFPFTPKTKGLEGFLKRIPCIFSDNYVARNFLAEIEDIKRRIKDLNRERQTCGISEEYSYQAAGVGREGRDGRGSSHRDNEPIIIGFDDHISSLVAKLQDEDSELRGISIIGMGGVGKTTLAKEVFNSVWQSFTLTAWVNVSQQPIIKDILQDIARQVGLKIKKWEDGGEAILYGHLRQNRYLLVIDDIWDTSTWDAIKIAIPTNSESRSRIMLTSRNRNVGVHIGSWSSLFELQTLEESYSKELFETSFGPLQTEHDPTGLKDIGEGILHSCGGSPLTIRVISGVLKLRERSVSSWNAVLKQLERGQDELLDAIDLCYMYLPNNLKSCFLYFGMFPMDYEIDTFDLINLWAAEGFLNGIGVREVEDVGYDYLHDLIATDLVQIVEKDPNGRVKSCRIRDICHSFCIRVANDINYLISSIDLTHHNCKTARRVTALGIGLGDYISSSHQTPKLRSFVCLSEHSQDSHDMEMLSYFPKHLKFLRVLYLRINIRSIWFSKEIWSLRNLTYLKLQCGERWLDPKLKVKPLEIPGSIITLESLLTLDLQDLGRELRFPMVIWNMKRLRHLLLPNELKLVAYMHQQFDPKGIQFQNFRTLVSVSSEIFQADWLHKLSNMRTLTFKALDEKIANVLLTSTLTMKYLETLQLPVTGERLRVKKLTMFGYQNLSNLHLENVDIDQWPQPHELPPYLTKIVLYNCKMKEDPLDIMKEIPELRVLVLQRGLCASGKLFCASEAGNFPRLEQLVVFSDYISEIKIDDGGMTRLEKFRVGRNTRLKVPSRIRNIIIHW